MAAGKVLTSDASGNGSWQPAAGGGSGGGNAWNLTGNSGTIDGVNFIGTTDNVPLTIRVNNQLSGRIDNTLDNYFLGDLAGASITNGNQDVFLGQLAGNSTTSGSANVAIGMAPLYSNINGGK